MPRFNETARYYLLDLIDSSELHIAMYDVALKRAYAFKRANTNFVGPDVGKEKSAGDWNE